LTRPKSTLKVRGFSLPGSDLSLQVSQKDR
jgi:hypothetical protein